VGVPANAARLRALLQDLVDVLRAEARRFILVLHQCTTRAPRPSTPSRVNEGHCAMLHRCHYVWEA